MYNGGHLRIVDNFNKNEIVASHIYQQEDWQVNMSASKKSSTKKNVELTEEEENEALALKYQEKNELEHILDRPDTEIGSIEHVHTDMWIYQEAMDADEAEANKIGRLDCMLLLSILS